MYMCICSYLPILNAFTQINIPIPPSPNTNSSIFVACYLFQDHILCTNFLFPLYISYPSLLKYRPPSHSNQRDNPLFLHANFSQIDITFPQQFKQSINLSMYMQVQITCIHAVHLTLKQYYITFVNFFSYFIEYSPNIFKIVFSIYLQLKSLFSRIEVLNFFFQIQTAL